MNKKYRNILSIYLTSAIACLTICISSMPIMAQQTIDELLPVRHAGLLPLRTEFINCTMRENAQKGDHSKNQYYKELELQQTGSARSAIYKVELDIPVLWLDRELFLHIEGVPRSDVRINEIDVAYTEDANTPAEINITPYITDGLNTITFCPGDREVEANLDSFTPHVYIYSQPKIRIEDYLITAEPDSLGKHGILTIRIAIANSYNFPETLNVGYDIYNPQGKLNHFDNRDAVVQGMSRDTIEFKEPIYGTPSNLWSAENPSLYYGMIIARHGRRPHEYIPYKVGFGKTEVKEGTLFRNGKPVEIKAVKYNSAPDKKTTAAELSKLKKAGINTILLYLPQPFWYYNLTDEMGLYVFDQPNLNFPDADQSKGITGTPANQISLLYSYMLRTQSMFARSRNHTSIVGWSLGGTHGNGYNLYKTYLWLKANEPSRAVIYNGAEGEWNSDMQPIPAVEGRGILDAAVNAPVQPRRR